MILYIWFLLTIPQDRLVCSLWVSQPPTQAAIVQACGAIDLTEYRLDVQSAGVVICSRNADVIGDVLSECALSSSLDQYRLNIVEENYQTLILCPVETKEKIEPTREEIARQCPDAKNYVISFAGIKQVVPAVTICKPPSVAQPASITTREDYYLLAGKLIWFGLAKANCAGGYSGVDPETFAATPCGMSGARAQMLAWQNGLDDAILASARTWNVPADLLKRIIADETQFWSWTGVDGEHGLIQITDAGAAVVLHVYRAGYYRMNPREQYEARQLWLRQLDCVNCSPLAAYDHAKRVMDLYAQSLAAYYCMFGSWDSAVRVWNVKHGG